METTKEQTSIQPFLFENEFIGENEKYEYELTRNESDFSNFLKLLFGSEISPKSISFSYMAKKWQQKFLKEFIEVINEKKSLQKLQKLRISNSNISLAHVLDILQNTTNSSLYELNLMSNTQTISDESVKEIAALTQMNSLKVLILKNNKQITDKCLEYLNFPLLESLNLSNCSITDDGLQIFQKENKNFCNLQYLNLSRNHDIQNFSIVNLPKLKELEVEYCKLQADFFKNLKKSKVTENLKYLNIGNLASYDPKSVMKSMINEIKEGNFKKIEKLSLENLYLENSELKEILNYFPGVLSLNLKNNCSLSNNFFEIDQLFLNKLLCLSLENCQISSNELEKKFNEKTTYFDNLVYLNVNNNPELLISGLKILLNSLTTKKLQYFFCANCNLTSEVADLFLENREKLKDLKELNLRGNKYLTNEGVKKLSICEFFTNLQFLNLSECGLDNNFFLYFLENPTKKAFQLRDLRLAQNKISSIGFEKLFGDFDSRFPLLVKVSIGSYECLDEFEGKLNMEKKGIAVLPFIGDNFD